MYKTALRALVFIVILFALFNSHVSDNKVLLIAKGGNQRIPYEIYENKGLTMIKVQGIKSDNDKKKLLLSFKSYRTGNREFTTDHFKNLQDLNIHHSGKTIMLTLTPKPGTGFNRDEFSRCLKYTFKDQ